MPNESGKGVVYHPDYDANIVSGTVYVEQLLAEYGHKIIHGLPPVVQGGMGIGVSGWRMAKAVAEYSQYTLGTVSGALLHGIMVDALQNDKNDAPDILRILQTTDFPFPEIADRIIKKYHKRPNQGIPLMRIIPPDELIELLVCSAYVYVRLAKEGHNNKINLNLLEKTAMFNVYTLWGAMLAGLGALTVGAGIPKQFREVMTNFAEGKPVKYAVPVVNDTKNPHIIDFDPKNKFGSDTPVMEPPVFLSVISGFAAAVGGKRAGADFLVLESHVAAGHNAPPRDGKNYGERDEPNMPRIFELGLPVIRAGGCGLPGKLRESLASGFYGNQVGSLLEPAKESGMDPILKAKILEAIWNNDYSVDDKEKISSTGFPFKVFTTPNLKENTPNRGCTIRGLSSLWRDPTGELQFRCSAEPIERFLKMGGSPEETGAECLCRRLSRTAGIQNGTEPLITFGATDISEIIKELIKGPNGSYSIAQAFDAILRDKLPAK